MAASMNPTSGVSGLVSIGGHTYTADTWTYNSNIQVFEGVNFVDAPWIPHCTGNKRATATMSGQWDTNFNPNANSNKLGASLTFEELLVGGVLQVSVGIISDWEVKDDANGVPTYTVTAVLDYQFQDFSNALA